MKAFFKDKDNKISLGLFIVTIIVACLPLISRYCINGHDLEYHLLRIESLKEGILIGKPFLKVNTLFFGNAGYASSMFYSDFLLYIPAVLRVLGVSISKSYHIFVAIIFILCYGSAYYCTFKMTDNKYMASLAAILLTLAPYHLDDMLVRAAVGEYMAFIFIPFVIYGLYNVVEEDMSHPFIFFIGYGGLILTHPATLVLNVVFGLGIFILFIKVFIKKPVLILKVMGTTIVTMLATSFYWLPMLEQMLDTSFYVSTNEVAMLDAALDMTDVFADNLLRAGGLLVALIVPRLFISRKDHKILRYVDAIIIAGVLYGILTSNIFPWERLERFLGFVQFPWRLLTMTTCLLSISGAICLIIFVREYGENLTKIGVVIITGIAICLALNHNSENATGYYDYGDDYYSFVPFTANVIGGEWLPSAVTERETLIELSAHMYTSDFEELDFTRDRAVIYSDVPSTEAVTVPFIYYKGYRATLTKDDGEIVEIPVSNEGMNGMVLAKTSNQAGKLKVWYAGTTLQKIAEIVSILTFIILIVLIVMNRRYKKGKIKNSKFGKVLASIAGLAILFNLTGCESTDAIDLNGTNLNEIVQDVNVGELENSKDLLNALGIEAEPEIEEEEVEPTIVYNTCEKGYELEEQYFAIKVDKEGEEPVYTYVSIAEAEKNGAVVTRKSTVYTDIAEDYYLKLISIYEDMSSSSSSSISDKESLETALMNEADMLLFIENFDDDKRVDKVSKLAQIVADVILKSEDVAKNDDKLKYTMAAVLSKASYVLYDIDNQEELEDAAVRIYEEAEEVAKEVSANKIWAAAELFKTTKNNSYREVVESYEELENLTGFSYENPGYYGLFAYLQADGKTSYSISSKVMNKFFDTINSDIKKPAEKLLEECLASDFNDGNVSKEYITKLSDEIKLAVMANRISMSVEYVRYAKDRIIFLTGANPAGVDYLDSEHIMNNEPIMFGLMGVRTN